MFFIALLACLVVGLLVCLFVPLDHKYTTLDKIGLVTNILLAVLYIPLSLFGLFSVFAADSMFMYSELIQKIISFMILLGLILPFLSVASIVISVVLRKKGKSIASFLIQFVPIVHLLIILSVFNYIGLFSEVAL